MANPIIQSTQTGPGAGTPGQGRNDLLTAVVVNLSDTQAANAGATYAWVFIDKPIGSSATLAGAGTSTPSFTPDVTGSYWVQATVTGLATGASNEILAVPLPETGSRIPAFGEESQYDGAGNTKGWHEAITDFMRDVDSGLAGASTTAEFVGTTGADVAVGTAAPPTTGQVLTATSATAANWQTPSSSPTGSAGGDLGGSYPNPTVEALGTTGTAVTVGTAAPPTTGQVLTATSATAANWQTPPGSTAFDGEWALVDTIVITAGSGAFTFSSTGDGNQLHDVNGNVDKAYKITWDLDGSGISAQLEINGVTTNQSVQRLHGTGSTSSATVTGLYASGLLANGENNSGEWVMETAATGTLRTSRLFRASGVAQIEVDASLWNDSATNITSLEVNVTTGPATGTIRLYRRALGLHGTNVSAVKTAAYTARFGETVLVDPTGGTFTVTLPNINSSDIGSIVEVHVDANTVNSVTVDGDGADTIIGNATYAVTGPYTTAVFRAITISKWAVI